MSISTLIDSDDDFDEWESELQDPPTGNPPPLPPTPPPGKFRPSRGAERREAIDRGRGFVRHRTHERRED